MAIDEIDLTESSVGVGHTPMRLLETSPGAATRLLASGVRRHYGREQVVFNQGDEGRSVHIVLSGRFAIEVESLDGDPVTLDLLSAGEAFGVLTHLTGEPFRSVSVIALTGGETLMIPAERFDAIRRELPEIDRTLSTILAARLTAAHRRILELAQVPAPRRVIRILSRLARLFDAGGEPVTIPLSQSRLAGMAGTSRDTVNRTLARAEREGWLLARRQKIVILDAARLVGRAR